MLKRDNGGMPGMDLKRLRYCVVVAELGSFTKAASMLAIAQSALSRHVGALEAELGARLFHRTGRGAIPTDIGRAALPRMKALVAEADQLAKDMKAVQDAPTGLVRLGVLASLSPVLMTPLLSHLHDRCPGIRVRVIEGLTEHLDELLATGRIDIGLLYDNRQTPSATDEALLEADLFLVGRDAHGPTAKGTIDLASLARYPLVTPSPPNKLRLIIDKVFHEQRVALNVTFEIDAISTMRDLAAAGGIYTILPLHAVIADVAAGRLHAARIVNPSISRIVLLATSSQHPLDRAGAEVVRAIRDVTAELVRAGRLPARPSGRNAPRRNGSERSARRARRRLDHST